MKLCSHVTLTRLARGISGPSLAGRQADSEMATGRGEVVAPGGAKRKVRVLPQVLRVCGFYLICQSRRQLVKPQPWTAQWWPCQWRRRTGSLPAHCQSRYRKASLGPGWRWRKRRRTRCSHLQMVLYSPFLCSLPITPKHTHTSLNMEVVSLAMSLVSHQRSTAVCAGMRGEDSHTESSALAERRS